MHHCYVIQPQLLTFRYLQFIQGIERFVYQVIEMKACVAMPKVPENQPFFSLWHSRRILNLNKIQVWYGNMDSLTEKLNNYQLNSCRGKTLFFFGVFFFYWCFESNEIEIKNRYECFNSFSNGSLSWQVTGIWFHNNARFHTWGTIHVCWTLKSSNNNNDSRKTHTLAWSEVLAQEICQKLVAVRTTIHVFDIWALYLFKLSFYFVRIRHCSQNRDTTYFIICRWSLHFAFFSLIVTK